MTESNFIIKSLDRKKILVTGSSGFVGVAVISQLLSAAREHGIVLNLDLVVRKVTSGLLSYQREAAQIGVDISFLISEIGTVLIPARAPDIVFHFATPASAELNVNDPGEMLSVNVKSAQWICQSPRVLLNKPRVVFASSGAVYGGGDGHTPTPETCLIGPNPMSPGVAYAEGKRVAEMIFCEAGRNDFLDPVIARLFTFSGPGLPLDRHFAIGNFVRDSKKNRSIVVRSDGSSVRSYLDSREMADWLIRSAVLPTDGSALNIGSEHGISISQLASLVASRYELGTKNSCEVVVLNQRTKSDGFDHYVPSTSITRSKLGVSERISLSESIDRMFQF
jgi:dTDP-glucose 4,6-dehydratase